MKRITTRLSLAMLFVMQLCSVNAQLADGSTAPDFTATDLNGVSYNLYDILNSGKTVFIDISATWCGPCWDYHESHALRDLYNQYGPSGTNELMVFLVEGDASTNLADLNGTGSNTNGNWVAGTTYPILDNAAIADAYQIQYYPTIYRICPDKKTKELQSLTTAQLYAEKQGCPAVQAQPAVNIAANASNNSICAGASVTFTATPTNGGTPTYQWKVNGANVGTNSPTYTTSSLTNGQVVTCVMTASGGAGQATSNSITVTVNAAPTAPTVSSNSPVCAGTSVNLTASTASTATYAWTGPNGFTSTSQNPTIAGASSTVAGIYSLVVTANGCSSSASTTTVAVNNAPATPTVSSNSPVCAGSSINITTNAVGGASYAWSGPNGFTSTNQNPTINGSSTAMSGSYSLIITANGCSSLAGTSTVTVSPSVTPANAVAITSGGNPTCVSQSVTFTATPTNGGTNPSYQWKVNGINAGSNAPTFTPSSIANNDVISCVVTSNAACLSTSTATATPITMTVTTNVTPALSIAANATTICSGQSVTLTPSPTNGGTTPSYNWSVNGVSAGSGPSFTSSTLTNGSVVTCVLTSSSGCASPTTATSNSVTISVTPSVTPSLTVAYNGAGTSICQGNTAAFLATPTNGGSNPTFNWLVNGVSTGVTTQQFQSSTLANNSTISCILTSNQACASASTSISNTVSLTVNPTPVFALSSNSPICSGTDINLSSTSLNGASYSWTGPNGFSSTLQNPTIPSSAMANAGSYSLVVTQNGCSATNSTSVVVNNSPAVPTISAIGDVMMSSAPTGNQWNFNGAMIPGATNLVYTAPDNGFYTVSVTQNGCTSTSAPFSMLSVGINELELQDELMIFPNPSNGLFTLSINPTQEASYVVEIHNMNGQLIEHTELKNVLGKLNHVFDIQDQSKGMYFLHISNGTQTSIYKLSVQ